MEPQQTPKRRGRPPKNPVTNTTRLKKPAAKSLGPERRQTRHSRTNSGLSPAPAGGNINLLQDPSDYQITLVDVKSSYNKDTGMFTISGLRRGMIDIMPWGSASTATDSPKVPRVEIDLTLSDSDDAPASGDARVLAKTPSHPPSAKRKIADDEDIPEVTVSEKRQKLSVETSIRDASARLPLSPIASMGLMEVDRASQRVAMEERKFPEGLMPVGLIDRQELSPTTHSTYNHIRSTTVNDLEVSKGNASNQRPGGLHSALGSVSSWAKGSLHALRMPAPSEQVKSSLRTRESMSNSQMDLQNPSLQQLEHESTVGSSKFGQAIEAEPKGFTITEVGSEPDGLGDGVKTEPGSTSDSPIILDGPDEPARSLTSHRHQAMHEEQLATKQVIGSDSAGVNPGQQNFEELPISRGQQMVYEVRSILGERMIIPIKPENPNAQSAPEEKPIAITNHEPPEGRGNPRKDTRFEEEDVVFIKQRIIEERTSTGKDVVLGKGQLPEEAETFIEKRVAVESTTPEALSMTPVETSIIREQPTRAEQKAISITGEILNEPAMIHSGQSAFREQAVVSSVPGAPYKGERITTVLGSQAASNERAIPNKGPMFLSVESNLGERGAFTEEPVVIDTQATPHGRHIPDVEAFKPHEQGGQATPNNGTLAFGGRITHSEEKMALKGQTVSNERVVAFGGQVIPDKEVVILDDQDTPDEEAVITEKKATRDQRLNPDEKASPFTKATPVRQIASSEPPNLNEQIPQMAPSHNGIEIAATNLTGGSVGDKNVSMHTPWRRDFSGDLVASQREQLQPPNVSKECPVCKEKFRDMSIPDLRQHILSCLEEERPKPPEYADEEYLGLVRRTTVFLEDLGSDNGVGDDLDDNGLHISGPPILNGPLSTIARFRDTPMSDSERTLSEPISGDEGLPRPYEEKDISSDEVDSPAVDTVETIASSRFRTITDPEKFLPSLQDPEEKSTASLYRSIKNAAGVLKAWQDEWMAIEARVAKLQQRKAHNPRAVLDPVVFEDQKEADLYGYRWDPNPKKRGQQDPVAQRTGRLVGGRELRRRAPAVKALAVDSDAGTQEGGRRTRSRRGDGASDPNGSGVEAGRLAGIQNSLEVSSIRRGMKRSTDLMDADTPEQSDVPKRRGRPRLNPLPARIQDIRNGNTFSATSTESEGTPAPVVKRRGRPPKNLKASQAAGTKAENMEAGKGKPKADKSVGNNTPGTPIGAGSSGVVKKPKSAKRSAAMQAWWDQRKAEKKARMEAALAASAGPDADASAAGLSSQKPSVGKSTGEVGSMVKAPPSAAANKDTPVPQKRRGRPPKQPVILPAEAPGTDAKVHQPKRRGRPPKSGLKNSLPKPLPSVDGVVNHSNLASTANPQLGKSTGFEQYQQLASGSTPNKLTKKRRNLAGGDDASSSSKRARTPSSSSDADSDAMQSTESSSNDIDDDGDDSYYG